MLFQTEHLVFEFLDGVSLARAACVCKQWRTVAAWDRLWESLADGLGSHFRTQQAAYSRFKWVSAKHFFSIKFTDQRRWLAASDATPTLLRTSGSTAPGVSAAVYLMSDSAAEAFKLTRAWQMAGAGSSSSGGGGGGGSSEGGSDCPAITVSSGKDHWLRVWHRGVVTHEVRLQDFLTADVVGSVGRGGGIGSVVVSDRFL